MAQLGAAMGVTHDNLRPIAFPDEVGGTRVDGSLWSRTSGSSPSTDPRQDDAELCVCGHDRFSHHPTGWCMTVMSKHGEPHVTCDCLAFREARS